MADKADFIFDEDLTIRDADKIKSELVKLFKKKKIKIDLTKVTKMDLSIIQLLISTVREAKAKEKNLILCGPLDPLFSDFLEDMNLLAFRNGESILFSQMREGGISIES